MNPTQKRRQNISTPRGECALICLRRNKKQPKPNTFLNVQFGLKLVYPLRFCRFRKRSLGKASSSFRPPRANCEFSPIRRVQKNTREGCFGVPAEARTQTRRRRRPLCYPITLRVRIYFARKTAFCALFQKALIFYYFLLPFCKRLCYNIFKLSKKVF